MNAPYERSEAQEEAYQERWQAELDSRADIARKELSPEDYRRKYMLSATEEAAQAAWNRGYTKGWESGQAELREKIEQLEAENGWLRSQADDLRAQLQDTPKVLIAS